MIPVSLYCDAKGEHRPERQQRRIKWEWCFLAACVAWLAVWALFGLAWFLL